jgi:hypothetical protein
VDYALLCRINIEELDAEILAVSAERIYLRPADRIGDRQTSIGRRNIMVYCRHREIGPPHATIGNAQTFEGLWRSYFMDEV